MAHSKQFLVEQTLSRKMLTNGNSHQMTVPSNPGIQVSLNKNACYLVDQKNFSSGAELIKYIQLEQYIDKALSLQKQKK